MLVSVVSWVEPMQLKLLKDVLICQGSSFILLPHEQVFSFFYHDSARVIELASSTPPYTGVLINASGKEIYVSATGHPCGWFSAWGNDDFTVLLTQYTTGDGSLWPDGAPESLSIFDIASRYDIDTISSVMTLQTNELVYLCDPSVVGGDCWRSDAIAREIKKTSGVFPLAAPAASGELIHGVLIMPI